MSEKVILVDSAGWSDLILGVVVGALNLNLPDPKYMQRRIPTSSFQPPHFENKKYLNDTVRIADRIIQVMQPDVDTTFKVCSGYVLSSLRQYLRGRGFTVEEVAATAELQEKVERGYTRWCQERGAPTERLDDQGRFWTFLKWVAEKPELREQLVKTGWASWKAKWREQAFLRGGLAC
jgi:hypothetical protein